MKFIIFADKAYNYIRPLADGLYKTILDTNNNAEIWYDGIYWLSKPNLIKVLFHDIFCLIMNLKAKNRNLYVYRFWNLVTFNSQRKKQAMKECDAIIVVNNCPNVFRPGNLPRIELLRNKYKKPIVNYDFHYLPNQGWWKYLKPLTGHHGLERFDWYLPVGLTTEFSIPDQIPQIYNCIGMDVRSKDLYPEQKEFIALIDFKQDNQLENYEMIISVLRKLGIKYISLEGKYTSSEIRNIYRRCSIYFVCCRESFGLPVVEMQLCGALVFVPDKRWCPAHILSNSRSNSDTENMYLGSNFVCYDNNPQLLERKLTEAKKQFNAKQSVSNFIREYPEYYSINKKELGCFFEKIQKKEINCKTHEKFQQYNKYISIDDDYEQGNYI